MCLPKRFFWITLLLFFCLSGAVNAQPGESGDLAIKRVSDTILGHRMLLLPDPFSASGALRQLFPGKWYDLTKRYGSKRIDWFNRPDRLVSWVCPTCQTKIYPDVNGIEDPDPFPFHGGVATRFLSQFSYSDSSGQHYWWISFNHSDYDPDGFQAGRFYGGLVGMAKFMRVGSSWRLTVFEPAIAAYGSFSSAPQPLPLLIGKGQYAFMIQHINGGAGGPFDQNNYLIGEMGDSYREILAAYGTRRENGDSASCNWDCTYKVLPGEKTSFRDIAIICRGQYFATDKEGLPGELKGKVKGREHGNFKITHVFVYSENKQEYEERLPTQVSIQKK